MAVMIWARCVFSHVRSRVASPSSCILVAAISGSQGQAVTADYSSERVALQASAIELLVLRASIPWHTTVSDDRVVIAPASDSIASSLAAEILASMPKPLLCAAETAPTGVLLVSCQKLTGDLASQHDLDVRAWDGEWDPDGGVRSHIPSDGTPLLVYGRRESMLVSRPAFERWYRDYDTANPVGFAFREPTPDEQASGAHYIMIADWLERDPSKLPFPIDPFRR